MKKYLVLFLSALMPIVTNADDSYVDLGLPSGLLWATCNLGAESPEKYGTYYDWEKNPVIEHWDEVWRTPTKDDRDELVSHCTHTLTTINGIKGARYTGTNGNSIFLPFAGYLQRGVGPYKVGEGGQYWTTTQYSNNEHWVLAANRSVQEDNSAYYWPLTYFSFPVRPVTSAKPDAIKSISFDDGATERIYGIDGMPQRKLQKGLNIIRYRNGKTRKVVSSHR